MRAHWSSVSSWNRDTIPGFQNPAGKFIRHALGHFPSAMLTDEHRSAFISGQVRTVARVSRTVPELSVHVTTHSTAWPKESGIWLPDRAESSPWALPREAPRSTRHQGVLQWKS